MIRSLLNWIFNHIKERPTDEQLIAYGRQLEREAQRQPPTMRQRGYEQSAWNSQPSPQTDPQLLARLEAQKRKDDMKAFLHCDSQELPHIPRFNAPAHVRSGELSRTYTTRKLDADTVLMPVAERPDGFLL